MREIFFRLCLTLYVVLSATGCSLEPAVAIDDPVLARQWRMDKSGLNTLADAVQATDWQPMPTWQGWGFGPEPIWIRLDLRAADPNARMPWVLRMRPAFLDDLTVYDPTSGQVVRTGDAFPPEGDGLSSINFTVQIPALPQERKVYIRLSTTSTRTLNAEVMSYGQAQQSNRLQEWMLSLVVAASGIFGVWAGAQWWVSRDKVMGIFAIKQVIATTWAFFLLGFARVAIGSWFPEGALTALNSVIGVSLVGATFWFLHALVESYQPARAALQFVKVLTLGVMGLLLLEAVGKTEQMLMLANASVPVLFLSVLIAMLTAMPRQPRLPRQPIRLEILMVYMLVYGALNSLPSVVAMGIMPAHSIMLYSNLAHALLDGFVMFVILLVRVRVQRREQQQMEQELQRSQQNAELERRHREEQTQLFAMLAHEMKTPLATLRMWMEAGQLKPETMERAIADMNSVIDRCVHTGQLVDQGLQPTVDAIDAGKLTKDCIASCRSPERVRLAGDAADSVLHTDAQMLSIVLGNLLDNACKYSAPHSSIHVRVSTTSDAGRKGWCWEVQSQAGTAGLPDPERLFEKYYRAPHARRQSGSGLGLFLVKGLVQLLGGRIHYALRDGQPLFTVWVPDLWSTAEAVPEHARKSV